MIAKKTLTLSLKSLKDFAKKRLTDDVLIDLDARDECPVDIVRRAAPEVRRCLGDGADSATRRPWAATS